MRGSALYGQLVDDTEEQLLVKGEGDGAQQAGLPGLVQVLIATLLLFVI